MPAFNRSLISSIPPDGFLKSSLKIPIWPIAYYPFAFLSARSFHRSNIDIFPSASIIHYPGHIPCGFWTVLTHFNPYILSIANFFIHRQPSISNGLTYIRYTIIKQSTSPRIFKLLQVNQISSLLILPTAALLALKEKQIYLRFCIPLLYHFWNLADEPAFLCQVFLLISLNNFSEGLARILYNEYLDC